MRAFRTGIVAGLIAFTACGATLASAGWGRLFKDLYKPKSSTSLGKAKCAVCHTRKNGTGGLNPYGKLLKGKKMKSSSLKAVERKDPDKDKANNIAEIRAGTLPGDPKSKPKKK